MGIRPSSQSSPTAVTKHIGTDMDDVRIVADNIDAIIASGTGTAEDSDKLGGELPAFYATQTEVDINTGKVGITAQQASDITVNNAKTGITNQQASDITSNNDKVGITPTQASDITTNNAKDTDVNHVTIELPNVDNTSDVDKPISTATVTALSGKSDTGHTHVEADITDLNKYTTTEVDTLLDDKADVTEVALSDATMTKADFFALAEQRIRESAGSGFSEWGKSRDVAPTAYPINDGMWAVPSVVSVLRMGREQGSINVVGTSRTENPLLNINGISQVMRYVNTSSSTVMNQILFPPAPNGTKTYDSDTGVVTPHGSAAEAFEGLVPNGDFRNGTTGWELGNDATQSVVNGVNTITNVGNSAGFTGVKPNMVVATANMRIEIVVTALSDDPAFYHRKTGDVNSSYYPLVLGVNIIEVDDYFIGAGIFRIVPSTFTVPTASVSIASVSLMPVTEQVITTRKDFAFLEVWHEKISDKDIVCPLGNVQYGAGDWNGMNLTPLTSFGVAQGYSAFGEGDTTTVGNCRTWSTLSEQRKTELIQDPESNIYNDDGELIQVRYRIRVVEGLGDAWENTSPANGDFLRYATTEYVTVQGKLTSVIDINDSSHSFYDSPTSTFNSSNSIGHWSAKNGAGSSNTVSAHNGLCFAVPIALVQRLNQGAYHPSFNEFGCAALISQDFTASRKWYNNNVHPITSRSDCFIEGVVGVSSGYFSGEIGGVESGIPDGKFYDAIYAEQVTDLRMSSKVPVLDEVREKYKRNAIAATVRGDESVPFTKFYASALIASQLVSSSSYVWNLDALVTEVGEQEDAPNGVITDFQGNGYLYNSTNGNIIRITRYLDNSGLTQIRCGQEYAIHQGYPSISDFASVSDVVHVIGETQQTPTFETLPWTDIIGDPANIAATFPNGVSGMWIPVIPDGVISSYPYNRKNDDALERVFTNDNGVTWTANTMPLNSTTNSLDGQAYVATQVQLCNYETKAHFTQDADNSEVLSLGDVFASDAAYDGRGGSLISSLIAKVGVNAAGRYIITDGGEVTIDNLQPDSGLMYTDANFKMTHDNINLDISNDSPTIKTLDYLSHDGNGQLTLNYAYKEMVWDTAADSGGDFTTIPESTIINTLTIGEIYHITDGAYRGVWVCNSNSSAAAAISNTAFVRIGNTIVTGSSGALIFTAWDGNGFGDNNQFEITDGQSTLTDDNGNTVLYGTASFKLPYFYNGGA